MSRLFAVTRSLEEIVAHFAVDIAPTLEVPSDTVGGYARSRRGSTATGHVHGQEKVLKGRSEGVSRRKGEDGKRERPAACPLAASRVELRPALPALDSPRR